MTTHFDGISKSQIKRSAWFQKIVNDPRVSEYMWDIDYSVDVDYSVSGEIWVYLTPGFFCQSMGCHMIHAYRVAELRSDYASIVRCVDPGCLDCESDDDRVRLRAWWIEALMTPVPPGAPEPPDWRPGETIPEDYHSF